MFLNLWILNSCIWWVNCALGCLFIVLWVSLHLLGPCLFKYKRRKSQKHCFRASIERSTLLSTLRPKFPGRHRPIDVLLSNGRRGALLFLCFVSFILCYHYLFSLLVLDSLTSIVISNHWLLCCVGVWTLLQPLTHAFNLEAGRS